MFKKLLLISVSFIIISCNSEKKKTYKTDDDNFVDPVAIQPSDPPKGIQPLQPAQITAMPSPPPGIPAPGATRIVTAPGMNPPHGQPGHRCDIAVGAPLASAPPTIMVPPDPPKPAAPPAGESPKEMPRPVITTSSGEIKAVQIPAPEYAPPLPMPAPASEKKDSLNK